MKSLSVSVVIPSYNSEKLFKQYLADNIAYFASVGITDIIVVDDASTDDGVQYLQTHFPEVRLIRNKVNKRFSITCNRGVSVSTQKYIFFLNSDMLVKRMNWDKILAYLDQPDVFSIVPPIYKKKGDVMFNESYSYGYFRGGWMSSENNIDIDKENRSEETLPVLWSCGGALLCRRDLFEQLGGFDPVYAPFYVEDLDLCYRAWKRGFKSLYCPDGDVIHQHQSTIGTHYTQAFVEKVQLRNMYIFIWKNITSKRYLLAHIVMVLVKLMTFQIRDTMAICNALLCLPSILRYRFQRNIVLIPDHILLKQWSHLG